MFTIMHNIVQYIAAIANKPTTLVLKDLVLSLVKEFFSKSQIGIVKNHIFQRRFQRKTRVRNIYIIHNMRIIDINMGLALP